MKKITFILFIVFAFQSLLAQNQAIDVAQRIDLDGKVSVGGLQLFPSLDNPNDYYYMPDKVQIGRTAQGNLPQFSYLRFFKPTKTANGTGNSEATEAGGILHAVVELQVSDQQKQRAASELLKYNPNGKIRGSLTYDKCFFTLVTSLATKDYEKMTNGVSNDEKFPSMKIDSQLTKSIAGYGSGPVLEGEKAAISIRLTALGSQIFWHSLQMATPDISFQFEVEFSGYRRPIPAKIEANFDRIYDSQIMKNSSTILMSENETSAVIDSLYSNNMIKVTLSGDLTADSVITQVRKELVELMFDKEGNKSLSINTSKDETENKPENPVTSSEPKLDGTFGKIIGGLSTVKQAADIARTLFNEKNSYKTKKIRRKGIYVVELNRYTAKTIKSTFAENIGNFSRYKNDPRIFKQVNLDEMFGKQREITPVIDGFNDTDFGNLLNSVNVRLVKKHEKGATSTDEVTITKQNLGTVALDGKLMYAWKEDNDQARFDQYQYETTWSYVGVGDIKTPLKIEKEQSFTVYPPYKAADVSVVVAEDARLNAAIVKIYYKVGEKEMVKDLVFMPTAKTQPSQRILIPTEGNYEYQYEVIWKLKGGVTKTTPRTTETTTQIFLEIPQ